MFEVYHPRKQFPPARPGYKYCYDCEQEKLLNQFSLHKNKPFSYCKDCSRKRDRDRSRPYIPPNPPRSPHSEPTFTREGYRLCNLCGQERRLEEFRQRRGICIDCERARDRERGPLRRTRKTAVVPKSINDGYKFCNTCLREMPYADFRKSGSSTRDGYTNRCKQCISDRYRSVSSEEKQSRDAVRKASEDARRAEIREYDRQRYNTPQRRATHLDKAHKRRSVLRGAYAENVNYQYILERDGYWCYICERNILPEQELAFDHVIPLNPREGGLQGYHTEDNIKPTHRICNARKNNKQVRDLTLLDRRGIL